MKGKTKVAIIGDFKPDRLSHKATNEALRHRTAEPKHDLLNKASHRIDQTEGSR